MENRYTKQIPGYDGYYATKTGNIIGKRGKELKQFISCGYNRVLLYNGKPECKIVHRLIWETFNGPIYSGLTVDHINCVKSDNRLENLQLMSQNDNWKKFNDSSIEEVEGFKKIEGFENYFINTEGVVKSFKYDRTNSFGGNVITPRKDGYVFLHKDYKRYTISIKYLLFKYFQIIPEKPLFKKTYKNG